MAFAPTISSPLRSELRLSLMTPSSCCSSSLQLSRMTPSSCCSSSLSCFWKCCQCSRVSPLSFFAGPHPLGALACDCPHKPCEKCTFGGISQFVPILDPGRVPLAPVSEHSEKEMGKAEVPFGVVCASCGLSWRAVKVKERGLRKMSSVREALGRLAPSAGRLRKTRSLITTGLRAQFLRDETSDSEKEEPAGFETVKFSGIECSCGEMSSLEASFCFRVDLPAPGPPSSRLLVMLVDTPASAGPAQRYTDEGMSAKGHDGPWITLLGERHANPLRSNPVKFEDLI